MPKYAIHHIVMDKVTKHLLEKGESDVQARQLAELLSHNRPYANLGAIGPDLFFWAPDYQVADVFYNMYVAINKVIKCYDKIVEPIDKIKDAVQHEIDKAVSELAPNTTEMIKDLIGKIGDANDAYDQALRITLFTGVIKGVDLAGNAVGLGSGIEKLFGMFIPDRHFNRPELDWYWFDMLHYRRTGTFAQNLLKKANTGETKAYAYGYMSHIATDLIGHSFINQLSGSPYRMNPWRHATIENFMDTWAYREQYGESVNATLRNRLNLPNVDELPNAIFHQLDEAFRDTYKDAIHPIRLARDGFYSVDQIKETYATFCAVLELTGNSYLKCPEEPFSGATNVLGQAIKDAIPDPPPSPPNTPPGLNCTWDVIFGSPIQAAGCRDAFLNATQSWINYGVALLDWEFKVLTALIDILLVVYLSLPVKVLLAILYSIQLVTYQLYRSMRYILALCGLVSPEPDEIDGPIGQSLMTLVHACGQKYPSSGLPARGNLVCPTLRYESPLTMAGPYRYDSLSKPNSFIGDAHGTFIPDNVEVFAKAPDPSSTRRFAIECGHIGDTVPLTLWMINNALDSSKESIVFADWDLDSDRGYGYRAWHGFIDKVDQSDWKIANELYPGNTSVGDNCFSLFEPTILSGPRPSLINAYLLSIACQYDFPNELYVDPLDNTAMYEGRFRDLFGRWGMNPNPTRMIFLKEHGLEFDTEVVVMEQRSHGTSFVIVLFRGSETPLDPSSAVLDWLLTDFDPIPVSTNDEGADWSDVWVHRGFWNAYRPIADKILTTLHNVSENQPCKVWVTGNSLGGALATLCGIWLKLKLREQPIEVEGVYTFASPKCGNQAFKSLYDRYLSGRCHRWVNGTGENRDIVTTTPPDPTEQFYTHVGNEHQVNETAEYLFSDPFALLDDNLRAHATEGYSRGLFRELVNTSPELVAKLPLPAA